MLVLILIPRLPPSPISVLVKICRRDSRQRHFFLLSDLLVYGTPVTSTTFVQQRCLEVSSLNIIPDEMTNSFKILSPGKSFVVFSPVGEEDKQLWVSLLVQNGAKLQDAGGDGLYAAIWKPDHLSSVCLVCNTSRFTTFNRRVRCPSPHSPHSPNVTKRTNARKQHSTTAEAAARSAAARARRSRS